MRDILENGNNHKFVFQSVKNDYANFFIRNQFLSWIGLKILRHPVYIPSRVLEKTEMATINHTRAQIEQ